jgi:Hypoxia induced protein conserved region
MFRARIYAQGFTLLALVGGSIFWKDDRMNRKEFEKVVAEKKAAEKREKWLNELEMRDREDKEWRKKFEGLAVRAKEAEEAANASLRGRSPKVEEGAQKVGREAIGGVKPRARKVEDGAQNVPEKVKRRVEKSAQEVEEGVEKLEGEVKEGVKQGKESMKGAIEKAFQSKSVLEQVERTGWRRGTWTAREAWRGR